jgi:ankyrin repeat protein
MKNNNSSTENQEIENRINELYLTKFSPQNKSQIDEMVKISLNKIIDQNNLEYLFNNSNNLIFLIVKYDLSEQLNNILNFISNSQIASSNYNFSAEILVNLKDKNHFSLLHLACIYGSSKVAEILILNKADISSKLSNQDRNWMPIHLAVKNNHLTLVNLLLQNGASIESKTYFGLTPFLIACEFKNKEIAKFLIDKGCEIDVKTIDENNAMNALHYSCLNSFDEFVEDLIELKFDIDEKTTDLSTPLQFAANSGSAKSTELLLRHGADFKQKNQQGKDAIIIAINKGNIEVLKVFLKYGIIDFSNLIKEAKKKNNQEIIELLTDYQKNIDQFFNFKKDQQNILNQIENFNDNNLFEDLVRFSDKVSLNAIGVLSVRKKIGLIFREEKTLLQAAYDDTINANKTIDCLIKLRKKIVKKISAKQINLYQI